MLSVPHILRAGLGSLALAVFFLSALPGVTACAAATSEYGFSWREPEGWRNTIEPDPAQTEENPDRKVIAIYVAPDGQAFIAMVLSAYSPFFRRQRDSDVFQVKASQKELLRSVQGRVAFLAGIEPNELALRLWGVKSLNGTRALYLNFAGRRHFADLGLICLLAKPYLVQLFYFNNGSYFPAVDALAASVTVTDPARSPFAEENGGAKCAPVNRLGFSRVDLQLDPRNRLSVFLPDTMVLGSARGLCPNGMTELLKGLSPEASLHIFTGDVPEDADPEVMVQALASESGTQFFSRVIADTLRPLFDEGMDVLDSRSVLLGKNRALTLHVKIPGEGHFSGTENEYLYIPLPTQLVQCIVSYPSRLSEYGHALAQETLRSVRITKQPD